MSTDARDAELLPDLLYMFVFGPGRGESIVVRVPPDSWLVIDSCLIDEQCPAVQLLDRFDGTLSAAILTHRHSDHIRGFPEVLDWNAAEVIGAVDPAITERNPNRALADHEEHELRGILEDVAAAISTRWGDNPDSCWETYRKTHRPVGEATVEALHPTEEFVNAHLDDRSNALSSAFLLTWRDLRLLIGGDVEEEGWRDIATEYRDLGRHHGLKIPHHGSREAIGPCFTAGDGGQTWVLTPWSHGDNSVPRFEDGQGIHILLGFVRQVQMSGLPVLHDRQNDRPCFATRTDLFARQDPRPLEGTLPDGTSINPIYFPDDPLSCYVAVGFDADGNVRDRRYGAGAIVVSENGTASATAVVRTDLESP